MSSLGYLHPQLSGSASRLRMLSCSQVVVCCFLWRDYPYSALFLISSFHSSLLMVLL